ncbi:MAG: ATP-binding protein [Saprospiraceae bacterium]|nr:ATP-binding protein [Saprospiraceae bacterium]MCB9325877.1 ATP-binding protein [Lewinellaceae bacterium]
MHRDAQVTMVMGRNGTGKSYLAHTIIKAMKERVIVITLNGAPAIWRQYEEIDITKKESWKFKKGIKQVYYMRQEKDTMKYIHKYFRDGIIVFDDCRGYLTSNVDSDIYLKRLLIDFRHKMLDLFFVFHAPTDVPPRIWAFYRTAFIGATDAIFPKSRIQTDSAERIIAAQKKVNAAFRKALAKGDNSHYGLFVKVRP